MNRAVPELLIGKELNAVQRARFERARTAVFEAQLCFNAVFEDYAPGSAPGEHEGEL